MPGNQSISRPQTLNLDLSDPSLTGFASNVTGATWALTATSVPDGLAHQVSIRNDSANDKSAINIVLVGTDADGNAQTETLTGPTGSATVESTLYYKTLTSVTPASTWGADTADIGYVDEAATGIIPLNWLAEAIAALNVDVTGTINFTIQQTFDDFTAPSFTAPSQQVQWLTVAASQTADLIVSTTGGALGVRVLVNSYSNGAEIQVNINPTYVSNQPGISGGADTDVNIAQWGGTATTLGQKAMAASVPVVLASDQSIVQVQVPGNYETVAASQTAQVLGTAGATGDYLQGLLVVPATTSPGNVIILDNAVSITVFVGGASSVGTLVPFFIPIGAYSVSGAWKVTTGASVSVVAVGRFT